MPVGCQNKLFLLIRNIFFKNWYFSVFTTPGALGVKVKALVTRFRKIAMWAGRHVASSSKVVKGCQRLSNVVKGAKGVKLSKVVKVVKDVKGVEGSAKPSRPQGYFS